MDSAPHAILTGAPTRRTSSPATGWWIPLALVILLSPFSARADNSEDARARLKQVEAFRVAKQYAAMESLATAVRTDLDKEPHPDTALLVESLYQIFQSLNMRKMIRDTVGVNAGNRALSLLDADPALPDTLRLNVNLALGWLYNVSGRSAMALDYYKPALLIARRHPEWRAAETGVLFNTGMALVNSGQMDSALVIFKDALPRRLALNLPRDAVIGDLHAGIATVYEKQARIAEAREEYAAAIRAHEEHLGHDDPGMTVALSRAAAFEFLQGNYSQSVEYNQRGLRIAEAQVPPNKASILGWRLSLAQGLEQLGDTRAARDTYQQVVPGLESWLGPSHPAVFSGWISLAGATTKLGDGDAALAIYRHIRDIFAADSTITERLPLASATENMAMILSDRAPSDSALALAQEAEAIARSLPGSENTIAFSALCTQMTVYGRRKDWAQVDRIDPKIQAELDRYAVPESNQSDDVWMIRSELAGLRGRPADAVDFALTGARGARQRLTWNVRALSDQQALLLANNISGPLDQALHLAAGSDPGIVRKAWDELIRTRGLVGDEISRRRVPPANSDPALLQAHQEWVDAQSALAQHEVLLASSLHDASAESLRTALRARVDEAERRLVRDVSAASPETAPEDIGLDQVQAGVSDDQGLVGFASAPGAGFRRHLLAFVETGQADPTCLDLGPVDSLAEFVDKWKAALGEPDPGRRSESTCRKAGLAVSRAIWEPIARLTAGMKDLYVVPEAPVSGLPWGALPVGKSGYLVESSPVIHILAAERELIAKPPAPAAGGLLAVGGIDYKATEDQPPVVASSLRSATSECDSLALSRLEPLPATATEVTDVEAALAHGGTSEPATTLEGAEAGEKEFKRLAPGRRYLHIATHGLVLAEDCGAGASGTRGVGGVSPIETVAHNPDGKPGDAKKKKEETRTSEFTAAGPHPGGADVSPWLGHQVFLAFAGAARARQYTADANEGLLTSEEVATLDLRGTEWVVLSACHSAAAESWTRQGVLGMERAFHLAGARTVIASQWSVDDESTREWMRALYNARAEGAGSAADAMTNAARAVLSERRAKGRPTHPFYWAAFTEDGE